ncbi:MAG: hypothetical protein K2J15_07545, partial [Muribaculaceae bacterium]|nr:hypothetical protein [Muribaculaceae bacterium]
PTPQQNPQEPVITSGNITTEPAGVLYTEDPDATPAIDLKNYTEEGAAIPVLKNLQAENLNEGAQLVYRLEISATEDFATKQVINLTAGNTPETADIYYADPMVWNTAHIAVFGQSPKPQTAYYRIPVYIHLADTDFRYTSNDFYALEGKMSVSRMQPDFVIEEAYYVFGPFIGGNTPATGVAMIHSDRDEYDDPSFTYFFEVSESEAATGYSLMIAPASVKTAAGNAQQCYGAGQNEGKLVLAGQPIKVEAAGPYKLEVNMKEFTYAISAAPKQLYAPSDGAKFNKKCLALPTSDYVIYSGLTYLENGFTLTGQKGWTPVAYGQGDGAGVIKRIDNGNNDDDKIAVENKGSHWVSVDLGKMTVSTEFVKTLGIVGSFNGWGETDDPELKHDANFIEWKGEFTVTEDDLKDNPCEWKIRANADWKVSFGEPKWEGNVQVDNQADFDGANWKITEAGKYEVVFNCGTYPYTVTLTKK